MGRRLLVLGLLLLVLPSTAAARESGSIVGGHLPTRSYPYMASVGGYCGGSLVAARFVVTAAHCVDPGVPVDVAVGITQLGSVPSQRFYADAVPQRHPLYNPTTDDFDVAVLTLPRPAPDTQLRLPRTEDSALWAAGVTATAIGWGATQEGGPGSSQLLEVEIPVISDAECANEYPFDFHAQTMVCAFALGKDTCQGDSGGPLLVPAGGDELALAGATSWGVGCGSNPGVYSRIGAGPLNDWVRTEVPQVELSRSVAEPAAGQQVIFTATASNPAGSGQFGGYDALDWDTNGDGAFDDAHDVTSVPVTLNGDTTVSVRATREDADPDLVDTEVRTLVTELKIPPSPVNFSGGDITITEGQAATLTVAKAGAGAGSVIVTPRTGTAIADGTDLAGAPQTLTFTAGENAHTVTIATVDDASIENPESFRVDLGGHTGDLAPATPGSVNVTIVDNDVPPPPPTAKLLGGKTAKIARRAFSVRLTTSAGGHVRATVKDKAGRVLAQLLSRKVAAGATTIKLKLTPRGRAVIKRHRRVAATLTLTYQPPGPTPRIVLKRKLTLKR